MKELAQWRVKGEPEKAQDKKIKHFCSKGVKHEQS